MSRALPVVFSALLASSDAIALQRNLSTEDAGGAWSLWTDPGQEKRALLIIHGLLRTLPRFWPKIEKNFVAPNAEAGYNFTIVLHTSLSAQCSEKDVADEANGVHTGCNRFWTYYGASPEERRERALKTFAPYSVELIDSEDPCYSYTEPENRIFATTAYLQGRGRDGGCTGTVHMASRIAHALDGFRGKKGFSRVAIIRTDNHFTLKDHPKEDRAVLMDEACIRHPGASIIGTKRPAPIPGPYPWDYDHSWMLCDGSQAHVFRDAVAAFGLNCTTPCAPPRCPDGFCKGTVNCRMNYCESFATMERGGLPFSTMDDYMFSNYE